MAEVSIHTKEQGTRKVRRGSRIWQRRVGRFALAAVGLLTAACTDENGPCPVSTRYVEVPLTFSVDGTTKGGRMADGTVQEDGVFRGMRGIRLYSFRQTGGAPATTATSEHSMELPDLSVFDNTQNKNAKLYQDLTLASGTDYVLIYGEGTGPTDASGAPLDEGAVLPTLPAASAEAPVTFADIGFSPAPIAPGVTANDPTPVYLLQVLNDVAAVLATSTNNNVLSLYGELQKLQSGSSTSVKAAVIDLCNSVRTLGTTDISAALRTVVDKYINYYLDWDSSDAFGFSTWKESAHQNYPNGLNLPHGAAWLTFAAGKFSYVDGLHGLRYITPLSDYVKPPSLCYRTASPLKVSRAEQSSNYGALDWTNVLNLYTDGTAVAMDTKGVAVVDELQYAVCDLQTDIKLKEATDICDSQGNVVFSKDEYIGQSTVNTSYLYDGILFCGMLVGNQRAVDWKFEPQTQSAVPQQVVYDPDDSWQNVVRHIGLCRQNAASQWEPVPFHTLVYETPADQMVRVAVQLYNSRGAFYGLDGQVIPTNSYFYLAATLDPGSSTLAGQPTGGCVFKQDYTTRATLTISSLAGATNTVPDLHLPEMNLGLTVKLEWQHGWTPDYDIP